MDPYNDASQRFKGGSMIIATSYDISELSVYADYVGPKHRVALQVGINNYHIIKNAKLVLDYAVSEEIALNYVATGFIPRAIKPSKKDLGYKIKAVYQK